MTDKEDISKLNKYIKEGGSIKPIYDMLCQNVVGWQRELLAAFTIKCEDDKIYATQVIDKGHPYYAEFRELLSALALNSGSHAIHNKREE